MPSEPYTVEMSARAVDRLGEVPGLGELARARLAAMAADFGAQPSRGAGLQTLPLREGYSATVLVNHTERRLLLRDVTLTAPRPARK